jgi:hypothetical protein
VLRDELHAEGTDEQLSDVIALQGRRWHHIIRLDIGADVLLAIENAACS